MATIFLVIINAMKNKNMPVQGRCHEFILPSTGAFDLLSDVPLHTRATGANGNITAPAVSTEHGMRFPTSVTHFACNTRTVHVCSICTCYYDHVCCFNFLLVYVVLLVNVHVHTYSPHMYK